MRSGSIICGGKEECKPCSVLAISSSQAEPHIDGQPVYVCWEVWLEQREGLVSVEMQYWISLVKPEGRELYRPESRFLSHKRKGDLDMILQVLPA